MSKNKTIFLLNKQSKVELLKNWIPKVGQKIFIYEDMLDYMGEHTIKEVLPNGDLEVEGHPYINTINMEYYKDSVYPVN